MKSADEFVRGEFISITKPINYGPKRGVEFSQEIWKVLRVTKNTIQVQGGHRRSEFLPKYDINGELIKYKEII